MAHIKEHLNMENVEYKVKYLEECLYAKIINDMIKQNNVDNGNISDGYNTFDELYKHRTVLFSVVCSKFKSMAWKSKQHYDGTMPCGYFIAGIDTPIGQVTYHCRLEFWNWFNVTELPKVRKHDEISNEEKLQRIAMLANVVRVEPKG